MHTTPKVALGTFASSGFGLATAARLSAQSFRVFGTSRAPTHYEASSLELLTLDVTSETSVEMCIQTILERTGRIDLLVNCKFGHSVGAMSPLTWVVGASNRVGHPASRTVFAFGMSKFTDRGCITYM